MTDVTIENLITFEIATLAEDDGIALVLAYATTQERLSRGEMDSFAIGMTREKARALGKKLLEIADERPPAEPNEQMRH